MSKTIYNSKRIDDGRNGDIVYYLYDGNEPSTMKDICQIRENRSTWFPLEYYMDKNCNFFGEVIR